MANFSAYSRGVLQDARSLLIEAQRGGMTTISAVLAVIDKELPPAAALADRPRPSRHHGPVCPSCGRFVMVRPKGVAESVLVCPACRYSEYQGVR